MFTEKDFKVTLMNPQEVTQFIENTENLLVYVITHQ